MTCPIKPNPSTTNQTLEQQVNLLQELRPEASNHHEHDNHHPSVGYRHEGEDVVKSNAPSRQTKSEDEQPYEPEVGNA